MHLDRLISILETVSMSGGTATASDICAATGYPKPSVYRLLQDLQKSGLLESPEKGAFRIGRRLHRISQLDRSDAEINVLVQPLLAEFADKYGAACFLARQRGHGVEISQVEVPRSGAVSFLHPGLGLRPMHACSCSKVIAAYGNEALRREAAEGHLKQFTEHTHTDAEALLDEFRKIQEKGYGECVEELELGICSVAAPVRLPEAGVSMSVGVTGSLRVFTETFRRQVGPALIGLAQDVEERLTAKDP
ncbi:IclR family transcriptional regulator [Oricola sp.]|uniref:IclR family transcriptional regulator n=1 Tax=Oricola sp. TaxID=1979950 RepID=UPI003BA9EA70